MTTKGVHNAYRTTLSGFTNREGGLAVVDARDRIRFWSKVRRGGTAECWLWQASRYRNGYGQFCIQATGSKPKQVHLYAHRVAWILTRGPIPGGLHVLHRCDTRDCVNSAHLFLGTHTDNMRDAGRKGRLSVPRRRTRDFKDAAISAYLAGGTTMEAVAERFGVSKMTIFRWVKVATGGRDLRRTA